MGDEPVLRLLAEVYNVAPRDQQRSAEAQLKRFASTPEGLSWAVSSLRSATLDGHALFFAASVLESAVARRWAALPPDHSAAVHQCLWLGATSPPPSQPLYVTAKLTAALAHLACISWQLQFWAEVQACLAEGQRTAAGIRLLDATLETLHSLAQATSVGLRGKVLSAQVPAIQRHFREAQPIGLSMLCSVLHSIATAPGQAGDPGALHAAAAALTALRKVLANLPALPPAGNVTAIAVTELLCGYVGLIARREEGAAAAAVAALDCLWEMLVKPQDPDSARATMSTLLRTLCAACQALLQRWSADAASRGAAGGADDDTLAALVRLMVRLFETQLGRIEADAAAVEQLCELLNLLGSMMLARR
jgi:hypothetical protein